MCLLKYLILVAVALICDVRTEGDQITIDRDNELEYSMDRTADACEDFFKYACGNFENIHPIPQHLKYFDMMTVLTERNNKHLTEKLSIGLEAIKNSGALTAKDKAKLFYASCVDTSALDQRGSQPILDLLKSFGGWPVLEENWDSSTFNWTELAINLTRQVNDNYLFFVGFSKDIRDTSKYLPVFDVAYPVISGNRDLYAERIQKTLKAFGATDAVAKQTTSEILNFEQELSKLFNNDNYKTVIAPISELEANYSKFNWRGFLEAIYDINIKSSESIMVYNPGYIERLADLINSTSGRTVTNFVLWNLVDSLLLSLGSEFRDIVSEYNKKAQIIASREKQCIDIVNNVMNIATASILMEGRISPENSVNEIEEMVNISKSAAIDLILNDASITDQTRSKSLERISSFSIDLSFVDFLSDNSAIDQEYESVNIFYDRFFETHLGLKRVMLKNSARAFINHTIDTRFGRSLIGAEVQYQPMYNTLTVHPGLLLSPFYQENFPKFFKYGGLGIFIGIGLSYSFDEFIEEYVPGEGFVSWRRSIDTEIFDQNKNCIKDQYDSYTVHSVSLKDRKLGDRLNIADNMGLKFLYKAYEKWLTLNHQSPENEHIEKYNLTGKQMFFVSAAQTFCGAVRADDVKYHIENEPHAPGNARVIGMIVNSEDFSKQFNCSVNSAMNPEKKCVIW